MRRLGLIALIVALTTIAAGCGTGSPLRITERPEIAEILNTLPKMNYSVTVTPPVLQMVPLQAREGVYAASVKPDAQIMQDSLALALYDLQIFKEVKKAEGQPASLGDAVSLGRSTNSDILLIPKVKQFNVTYEGHNGAHFTKLVVWSLLEWVSWFMADELYRVDMTCEYDFRDGTSGSLLYSQVRSISSKKPVSDIQRGIKIWGIVRMPGSLHEGNYQNVGEVVGPHAIQDMNVNFLRSVIPAFNRYTSTSEFAGKYSRSSSLAARTREEPETPEVTPKPKPKPEAVRNIAYIFGVDNYQELTASRLRHAASDAQAFKEMLAKSSKPRYKNDDTHVLVNEWASLSAIRRALDDAVASSKNKLNTVIFYFAGRGAVVENELGEPDYYLLPQDADITKLEETALSLDSLASAFRLVNAEHVLIILDCGFDPAGEGRSVPTGANFIAAIKYPSALYTHKGYSLLTAERPGHPAFESRESGGGLLTGALIDAAATRKAAGSDGVVTMQEVFEHSKTAVPAEAKKLGGRQEPQLFGTSGSNPFFGR